MKETNGLLTARQELDHIQKFFQEASRTEAACLWCVLTALRGPDDGSPYDKYNYTIPIRQAAFPNLTLAYAAGLEKRDTRVLYVSPRGSSHFYDHVRTAARALGLPEEAELYYFDR